MTAIIGALFFLSGACSLIYEVVWARHLSFLLGNSTAAHTLVIATFMGGLGIGYWVAGRFVDRLKRPVRVWGVIELIISGWAALFPALLAQSVEFARPLLVAEHLLSSITMVLAVVCLLPPTILMGVTLPLLVSWANSDRGDVGQRVAWLYAVNSAGAVVGVLLSGFFLLEALGLRTTLYLAAMCNLLVATVLWHLSSRIDRPAQEPRVSADFKAEPSYSLIRKSFIAAGCLGFASLALQGVWIRVFSLFMGSSTYSLSVVIAVFITGIALGSELVRRWQARWEPALLLGGVVLCCALSLSLTGPLYDRIVYDSLRLKLWMRSGDQPFGLYILAKGALVFCLLVLPTAAFGMGLPLAAGIAARGTGGRTTGRVFATNTCFAVLGMVVTVPVLVPWLGISVVYHATCIGLSFLGVWLLWGTGRMFKGALAVALLSVLIVPNWDSRVMASGGFRERTLASSSFAEYRERLQRDELLFYRDGSNASVAVLERNKHRVLKVNGKADASTRGDMLTQVVSAHLPLLLHNDPEHTLIVGLGSGVTAGSAATHGHQVDVVELSSAVIDASRFFDSVNGQALEHPKIRILQADARSFLQRGVTGYDVIISEPSNPWVAGNAGLFTAEFFRIARSRLNPDGVMAQWFHLYEMDDATVRLVIRTYKKVFPHVTVWELFPNDLLLIGTNQPQQPDFTQIVRRMAGSKVKADLGRVAVTGITDLLSLQMLGPTNVDALLRHQGPINRDDDPILEFEAPRRLYAGKRATVLDQLDGRRDLNQTQDDRLLSIWLAENPISIDQAQTLFVLHTRFPGAPRSFRMSLLDRFLTDSGPSFLTDLLFTLERNEDWPVARRVAERLRLVAQKYPRGLYAVARTAKKLLKGANPLIELSSIRSLLRRCIKLGDDPLQRCQKMIIGLE